MQPGVMGPRQCSLRHVWTPIPEVGSSMNTMDGLATCRHPGRWSSPQAGGREVCSTQLPQHARVPSSSACQRLLWPAAPHLPRRVQRAASCTQLPHHADLLLPRAGHQASQGPALPFLAAAGTECGTLKQNQPGVPQTQWQGRSAACQAGSDRAHQLHSNGQALALLHAESGLPRTPHKSP